MRVGPVDDSQLVVDVVAEARTGWRRTQKPSLVGTSIIRINESMNQPLGGCFRHHCDCVHHDGRAKGAVLCGRVIRDTVDAVCWLAT
jgi:hypothetical protein